MAEHLGDPAISSPASSRSVAKAWRSRESAGGGRAVVTGIRRDLTRPDPIPFSPPPVDAWIRSRYLATERHLGAEWNGRWHLFSGDLLRLPAFRVNDVDGRTRCGVRLPLHSLVADHVAVPDRPEVDACGRCSRIAAA